MFSLQTIFAFTICPRSSDPFYIVSYYIKWVTTSWTYSMSHYKTFIEVVFGTRIRAEAREENMPHRGLASLSSPA